VSTKNTNTHIKYHGYNSSRNGDRRKIINIEKEHQKNIFFQFIFLPDTFCMNTYIKIGNRKNVAYFISIDIIKNKKANIFFFFPKRKKAYNARNIITMSLCALTNVSIITSGLNEKITTGRRFFDILYKVLLVKK
jgi:hypothetical protein